MNIIEDIHKYLAPEISTINKIILGHLRGRDQLIKLIGEHLTNAGGKRIRPVMTLLVSRMFNSSGVNNLKLATAVEFIHAATLLHDDVVDNSAVRRFKPTANFIWGNKASILVGDFLLSQAFQLMIEVRIMPALSSLSKAASKLIEGEVSQLTILEAAQMISKKQYDLIIKAKTAELFGSSCEIGAILANEPQEICNIMKEFGLIVGCIFQITDDLLDYLGTSELIGKNPGDDFFEGKVTLPVILLYEQVSATKKTELEDMIKNPERTHEDFEHVQQLLKKYEIKKQILQYLEELQLKAHDLLAMVDPKTRLCKDYLIALIDFSINRSY